MLSIKMMEFLNSSEGEIVSRLDEDVREIFSTMVPGDPVELVSETETSTHFKASLSAMVGFAGSYSGMISINTTKMLALKITSEMLGMELDECEEDIADSLGEIANMIGGSFKHRFVKNGKEVKLSTPSVITGEDYQMTVGTMPDSTTLLFRRGEDTFTVSLYLESDG